MKTHPSRETRTTGTLANVLSLLLLLLIAAAALAAEPGGAQNPASPHPTQAETQSEIADSPSDPGEPDSAPTPPPKPKPQAESYPAVPFGPAIEGAEVHRLDSLALAQYPPKRDTTVYYRWWEAKGHPYLDSVLPGARYLIVRWFQPGVRYGNPAIPGYQNTYVLYRDRLYPVTRLNQLLLAAGFGFDSTDAPTAAKVAVLLSRLESDALGRPDMAYCWSRPPASALDASKPALSIAIQN